MLNYVLLFLSFLTLNTIADEPGVELYNIITGPHETK